jgi:hypothetical protein
VAGVRRLPLVLLRLPASLLADAAEEVLRLVGERPVLDPFAQFLRAEPGLVEEPAVLVDAEHVEAGAEVARVHREEFLVLLEGEFVAPRLAVGEGEAHPVASGGKFERRLETSPLAQFSVAVAVAEQAWATARQGAATAALP